MISYHEAMLLDFVDDDDEDNDSVSPANSLSFQQHADLSLKTPAASAL